MQRALERWRTLLHERAQQMDAAYARLGRTSKDFWNRRARTFYRVTKDTVTSDPFYLKVSQKVTAQTSVLDVGAGTGRFSLALAPQARQVTAVEPNSAMLNYLRQDVEQQGLNNVSFMPTTWQDAPSDLRADLIICSHVLYPIWDIDTFLAKLQAATLGTCYLYLRSQHFDAITAPLWRHFHGDDRCLSPEYIHALDVLYEMGIYANVEIVRVPQSMRFPSLDVAVEELAEELIIPEGEQAQRELRAQLDGWLVERDGMLYLPAQHMTSAIISWEKG